MTKRHQEGNDAPSEGPLVLAIDTATGPSSVAALRGEARLAGEVGPGGRDTDRWIFGAIRRSLEAAEIPRDRLDVVAVTVGPGAFTGIRVGVSTALGIAAAAGLPVAGVGTLEALAEEAVTIRSAAHGPAVLACHDARRQQVYAAIYELEGTAPLPLEPTWGPEALAPVALIERLRRSDRSPVAIGSGLDSYPEVAAAATETVVAASGLAAAAGRLAGRTLRLRGATALPPARPRYLRAADIRLRPSPLTRRRRRGR